MVQKGNWAEPCRHTLAVNSHRQLAAQRISCRGETDVCLAVQFHMATTPHVEHFQGKN